LVEGGAAGLVGAELAGALAALSEDALGASLAFAAALSLSAFGAALSLAEDVSPAIAAALPDLLSVM
jgi:hypothetical protein